MGKVNMKERFIHEMPVAMAGVGFASASGSNGWMSWFGESGVTGKGRRFR